MYTLNNKLEFEHVDKGIVIYNSDNQESYYVNETAGYIIKCLLNKKKDLNDIVNLISKEYNIEKTACEEDVKNILIELLNENIVKEVKNEKIC